MSIEVLPSVESIDELASSALPGFLAHLAALQARAASRLASPKPVHDLADDLIDLSAAARRLGMSKSWVYHRLDELPFVRRIGRRSVRFSARGIARYLETQSQ